MTVSDGSMIESSTGLTVIVALEEPAASVSIVLLAESVPPETVTV